ncbi:MAG TPA: SemiSWEET transporter [Vicinamibacterales bacterium]|jgi:MtN3 and saliva related transmembrane protein|nr:SemiSWEET transporter [Vicinamibacterales bacterium]
MPTTLIGLIAGTLTTVSFVPQVMKSWRRKSVADLSMTMLLTFTAGVGCWDIYGVLTRTTPIVLANTLTLVLALALLYMKVAFGK